MLNLIIGFTGGIDWRAHLGGLATGTVLALLYDVAGNLRDRTAELAVTVGGSAAILAVFALLLTGIAPGHGVIDTETKIAILFHSACSSSRKA